MSVKQEYLDAVVHCAKGLSESQRQAVLEYGEIFVNYKLNDNEASIQKVADTFTNLLVLHRIPFPVFMTIQSLDHVYGMRPFE